MALGYGYVQRDPEDQQLNWAQIGKDVSDRLEGEITKREEKKEQLDNLTSDLVKELNTSQFLTENSNFNKFVLDSSDTIKNQTLLANKLLKSGQLKPREFTLMMQNIVDGTDQTFGLFQDYKDEYEKKMAMMAKDLPVSQQGSGIMYGILENVEGFSNFQNHQLVLNPDSGVMSIGKVIDGKVSTNPNDLTSVEQLKNRIRTTINKFDLYGSADSYVESLGETTEEIIKVGNKYRATEIQRITGATGSTLFDLTKDQIDEGIKEGIIDESDVKALREFNKGIDTYVESELGIDGTFSSASLLADYFPGYTTTFDDKAPYDSKKILLRSVGGRVIADLSEEQKDLAKDTLKSTIRNGLSKKTQTTYQQTVRDIKPSSTDLMQKSQKERQQGVMQSVVSLYNAEDEQEMNNAISILKSNNSNIDVIDRRGDELLIKFKDGSIERIKYGDNVKDFASSTANFFLDQKDRSTNPSLLLEGVTIDENKPLSSIIKSKGTNYETKEGLYDSYISVLREEAPDAESLFVVDSEGDTVDKLTSYVKSLPGLEEYTVDQNSAVGFNDAVVIKKDGEIVAGPFELDASELGTEDLVKEALVGYLDKIHQLSFNVSKLEDAALRISGKRKSTIEESKIESRGKLNG